MLTRHPDTCCGQKTWSFSKDSTWSIW